MKKITLIAIAILVLGSFVFAGSKADQEAVEKASMNYIEGFYEGDESKLKAAIAPNLKKHGFRKKKDSDKYTPAGEFPYSKAMNYAKYVREKKSYAKPNSPKKVELLEVSDKIAISKVYANWGIDYMLLAKNDGKWLVHQILWEGPERTSDPTEADRKAVKKAGMLYLEGFYEGDQEKLKNALLPTMYKYGYGYDKKKGEFKKGGQMTYEKALAFAREVKEKKWFPKKDAPKKVEVLDIMNKTAAIKVTGWWGIDYMLLSKQENGTWMFEHIMWSGVPPKKA